MRLAAFDPFVNAERARQIGVQLVPTIEKLFESSDFVSIHATKTPQTINLVNAAVRAFEARTAPDQRRPRRDRRRGARRSSGERTTGWRRDRHVRERADDRVPAVRCSTTSS